jgi:hypothetical protein
MFDAEMLAVSLLSKNDLDRLEGKGNAVLKATRRLFDDPYFDQAVRVGTNTPTRVRYRIETMTETLSSIE